MTNFNKALKDPSGVYNEPKDVLVDRSLSREQKIKILRQWEYDARELLVADEENMAGESPSMLNRVLTALHKLEQGINPKSGTPTKQGGDYS